MEPERESLIQLDLWQHEERVKWRERRRKEKGKNRKKEIKKEETAWEEEKRKKEGKRKWARRKDARKKKEKGDQGEKKINFLKKKIRYF